MVLPNVVPLKRVAMEQLPSSFGFMHLPFVALRFGASFILCMYGVILKTEWMLRLLKLMMNLKHGPTKVGNSSLGPQSP
jgi:hypothetical protein